MAKRGGQPGNLNAVSKSDRPLREAILMAVKRDPARTIKLGEKLMEMAIEGNLQAASLIMDRLEGKAIQAIQQEVKTTQMVVRAPEISRNADEWKAMYAPPSIEDEADKKIN
jgi:hypothetical protein